LTVAASCVAQVNELLEKYDELEYSRMRKDKYPAKGGPNWQGTPAYLAQKS